MPSSLNLRAARNPLRGAALRQGWSRWWQSRAPLTDQIALNHRNVYILPTGPGLMLAVTLLVLLLASINFQLNLGYLLTFMLAGAGLVSMHMGHATLTGLALRLQAPEPGFAGGPVLVTLEVTNPSARPRHGIALQWLKAPGQTATHAGPLTWTDAPANGSSTVQLEWGAPQRGLHRLPTLTAESRFPIGMFRVWTLWRPAAQVLVYPQPEAAPPPLRPDANHQAATQSVIPPQTYAERDGLRPYRRGDALKHVAWKKAAKAPFAATPESPGADSGLIVREAWQPPGHELWLDCALTGLPAAASGPDGQGLPSEPQLSRLCAWVLEAERLGLRYGLRLPQHSVEPGSGESHQRKCLKALALC